jgi:citronellol/citronellal dehydrogenase
MKKYDLVHAINSRGTFLCSKLCLPHLKKAENPHILNISPPLDMFSQGTNWFSGHGAYTAAKYGMTLYAYGMAEEFKPFGIGVNTLWPRTAIATAAVQNLLGGESSLKMSRKPSIMADAAWHVLTSNSKLTTGNFFMDDVVLISKKAWELGKYACVEGTPDDELMPDYFC